MLYKSFPNWGKIGATILFPLERIALASNPLETPGLVTPVPDKIGKMAFTECPILGKWTFSAESNLRVEPKRLAYNTANWAKMAFPSTADLH